MDTTRQYICSTVLKCQWHVLHCLSTVLDLSRGNLLVCGLAWIHCLNCTVNVNIQFVQSVRILTHTILKKLRGTANYICFWLLNVAFPTTFITSHYCFLSLYPHSFPLYLTVNSDKKQVTHKALNADVLHTDRHSGCVFITATPAARLSTTPTFGFFIQNVSLNMWVRTNAVQLLYSSEGRKKKNVTSQVVNLLTSMWNSIENLTPLAIGSSLHI